MNNQLKYKLGINGFKNTLYCIEQNQDMNAIIPREIEICDLMNDLVSLFEPTNDQIDMMIESLQKSKIKEQSEEKTDYNELIRRAKRIARHAHHGQLYGVRNYYMYHVEGVVELIQKVTSDPVIIIVGLLHDVVEDSDCYTINYIKNNFGTEIGEAVNAITKRDGETRDEYLTRCRANSIASFVKLHDATFNLNESKKENNTKRMEHYSNTIKFLLEPA